MSENIQEKILNANLCINELILKEMNSVDNVDKTIDEHFNGLEFNFESLEKINNETKLLFPSYFMRVSNMKNLKEAPINHLRIMMESGSVAAYKEFKKRQDNKLSKMSDEFLILGIQQTDGREELEVLTKRYSKFIQNIINMVDNKYYFKGQEKEDLIQEANIGLMKAIEVFKVERRTKFKDFSRYVIERHLGTLMYRSNNLRNRTLNESISYNSPVLVVSSSQTTTFEDLLEGDPIKPDSIIENKKLFELIKSQLTENEIEVLYPYADGYTYEEIAFKLIISKGVMNFKGLDYTEVSAFLKLVQSKNEYSKEEFELKLLEIPYAMILPNEKYYLCGYSYEEIFEKLKRRKKSVDNTIQRMRNKGFKQRYSFENDGKQWEELEPEVEYEDEKSMDLDEYELEELMVN